MIEKRYVFLASNKIHSINTIIWLPDTKEVKGIIQISHGMSEHIYRYKHLANFFTTRGFIVCGNDHAGHGKSIKDIKGFVGKKDGYENMTKDLNHINEYMKLKFGNLPYFLIGHSMGSFLARYYCTVYKDTIDGVIFSGTKGSEPLIDLALSMSTAMIAVGKGKSEAKALHNMQFKHYNDRYVAKTEFDWLSRDEKVVENYINDDNCGFIFTYYGYRELLSLLKNISSKKWYEAYPVNLPTYLISGKDDPVGDYGDGVMEVYNGLKKYGVSDIKVKLYENARHEVFNEINKKEVYNDVLNWITSKIDKK